MKPLSENEKKATKKLLHFMSSQRISFGIGSIKESSERVERDTTIYSPRFLRRSLLHTTSLRRNKEADTLIMFGCLSCFGQLKFILSCVEVLDLLGVKYTFLRDSEYCCYAPSLFATFVFNESDRAEAEALSKKFIGWNIDQARDLSIKEMAHFCQACYLLTKHFYADEKIAQKYHLDILVERLQGKKLNIIPKKVLYFGGCWRRYRFTYPDVDFNLDGYRALLSNIYGLDIVDCPSKFCCVTSTNAVFARAEREGIGEIVTPCAACHEQLEREAHGRFKVKMNQDIVLEALKYGGVPA